MLDSRDDEVMTEDELVAMYLLILFGGSETTTNLLGNGFLALQRHRDQWDLLARATPTWSRGAMDELMRYDSPHHYLPRVVDQDFELHGTTLQAGQTAIVVMGAANRDESKFPDPTGSTCTRPNKREHLSFAFGAHYCLGAALARLEGDVVFSTLLRRFPDARLLDDQPAYGGSAMLRAIQSLPTDLGTPALTRLPPRRPARSVPAGHRGPAGVRRTGDAVTFAELDERASRFAARAGRRRASARRPGAAARSPTRWRRSRCWSAARGPGLVAVPVNWRLAAGGADRGRRGRRRRRSSSSTRRWRTCCGRSPTAPSRC